MEKAGNSTEIEWWKTGIIYEVYVRSFKDSSGDGLGDLKGIMDKLDYLQWLGIEAIWLTPFYPSPMKDMGYDIADYKGVDPMFGNMEEFDRLLREVHRRDMKMIIDFVPNHTSDQHPWFLESKASKDNPKRDWYYWKDADTDGNPPNNWLSVLGGSAWEWDEKTQQYYYHAFLKEQPDLNLNNPEVQQAVLDVMRFWLDKGVDGLRVDVMWHLVKDEKWRDNPVNPDFDPKTSPECDRLLQLFSCDQPEVHDVVCKFRELMDAYGDKVMMGELYLPIHQLVAYYGAENEGAHLPGNFQLLFTDWSAQKIGILIDQYEAVLPQKAWPNWVIGNHDRRRLIDRIGKDQTKVAAMLLLTLRGTPILYYGDEIGMSNVKIPEDEWKDPQGILQPGKNLSRDPQRTPMQWDDSDNAGFTIGKPWLRIGKNYKVNNVQHQKKEHGSLLNFYKALIALRQKEPALYRGDYYPVITDGKVLAYLRKYKDKSFLVVLNLTDKTVKFRPEKKYLKGKVVLSTIRDWKDKIFEAGKKLEANEGILVEVINQNQQANN